MSNTIASQHFTFAENSENDLFLDSNNNLATLSGVDALAAICNGALQGQLREMIYDQTNGLPYMDTVFRKQNLSAFVAAGRLLLQNIFGVVKVVSFNAFFTNGKMQYSVQIQTIYSAALIPVSNQGV
jgi:hypothetical protein